MALDYTTETRFVKIEGDTRLQQITLDTLGGRFQTIDESVARLWRRVDTLLIAVLVGSTASLLMSVVVFVLVLVRT